MVTGAHVVLSRHALERLGERFPHEDFDALVHRTRLDVAGAFEAGRVARHLPRLLVSHGPRPELDRARGRRRFAWTSDGSLVAVVRRLDRRDDKGCRLVLVVTLWPPSPAGDFSIEVAA